MEEANPRSAGCATPNALWNGLCGTGGSLLAQAVTGHDVKGIVPLVFYSAAIPLAFVHPALSGLLYVAVAAMWFVPDRRIEAHVKQET